MGIIRKITDIRRIEILKSQVSKTRPGASGALKTFASLQPTLSQKRERMGHPTQWASGF